MSNRYARIAFSEAARERQRIAGSYRDYGAQLENGRDEPQALEMREKGFIRAADSFFLGTTTPDGWPYIQHRGGPQGFVQVLDDRTIAFADLSGNHQYVTVGNLTTNDRVTLFFIDYPLRERLKLYGRARMVERADDPDLVDRVASAYTGAIQKIAERAILITVEATNWNCVKYIRPRFTKARLDEAVALERRTAAADRDRLTAEIDQLRRENEALRAQLDEMSAR
ncbi:pyridoxamine 5'-phosphate oxidase family protein [Nocardia sp. CDC160]|uniref:pyridoxamine 5'-phosphate oxidase family protein n=1 Tax=Nocardia sp. CDC160 TaxID=3112166 RepID=UPI002DBD0DB3|nr:pyridoxamine 5'-phosphate oxidase family protein [Nocardia sp. CDC160]MEC3914820.1 pyridoxamine 5'-phosphate oxidase family protein [Nocardia sp. CDC160]